MKVDKDKLVQGILLILAALFGGVFGGAGYNYATADQVQVSAELDIFDEIQEGSLFTYVDKTVQPGDPLLELLREAPKEDIPTRPKYLYEIEARYLQVKTLKGGGQAVPEIVINDTERFDHTYRLRTNLPKKYLSLRILQKLLPTPVKNSELEFIQGIVLVREFDKG